MTIYTFTMDLEVSDVDTLYTTALEHATQLDGLTADEASEILKPGGVISVEACIQTLFDPGSSAGCEILQSRVD